MQLTGKITLDNLMSLEAYSRWRKTHKPEVIAHRKLRSVALGEHMHVQFESELSIRYQIQEILRIEKVLEKMAILQEIETYASWVPEGSNWNASMMIEYADGHERKRELVKLVGVEDHMFVEVEGHDRVYALADEGMDCEDNGKTSVVHFLRFELTPVMCAAVKAGAAVKMGCEHTHYLWHVDIPSNTLASLAGDLK